MKHSTNFWASFTFFILRNVLVHSPFVKALLLYFTMLSPQLKSHAIIDFYKFLYKLKCNIWPMVVQVHFWKNIHQDFVVQKQFTNYNIKKFEPIKYIPCCMIEFHLGPCIGWHLIASSTIFKDQEKDHYAI